jgi:adenylate cyclase
MDLTRQQLAQWVGEPEGRIDELIAHGLLEARSDGRFDRGAVHVARFTLALLDSGIPIDALAEARAARSISLAIYPMWFPDDSSTPGRPFGEFLSDLGGATELVPWIYRSLGLAEPDTARRIDEQEQAIIWELVGLADSLGDRTLLRRAFATYSAAASKAVEQGLALYAERFNDLAGDPAPDAVEGLDPRLEPWSRLSRMGPRLIAWLYRRHLEDGIDSFSVDSTERYLAQLGYVAARPNEQEAIVFADIAGYTSIVEQGGDMLSALLSTGVGDLASAVARRRGGRLVKILGDGAMLHFPTVESAIEASVDMLDSSDSHEMPALHIGISSGPTVYRDGDYYGHTVNTAARLSAVAPPGMIYATEGVAMASTDRTFQAVGPLSLKGMSEPVSVYAVETDDAGDEQSPG